MVAAGKPQSMRISEPSASVPLRYLAPQDPAKSAKHGNKNPKPRACPVADRRRRTDFCVETPTRVATRLDAIEGARTW
jgi:hypothetical protein